MQYQYHYEDRSDIRPPKKHNHVLAVIVAVVTVAGLCVASGLLGAAFQRKSQGRLIPTTSIVYQGTDTHPLKHYTENGELTVEGVAAVCAPSVVEIRTEEVVGGGFFQQYIEQGAGSGVIVSDNGYIVTNHHVVDGAEEIVVTISDGQQARATLVNSDAVTDIAVIKIEAEGLIPAVIYAGEDDGLRVGQTVVAIGNPLGSLGGSVTDGIISALERDVVVDGQKMKLMQTNAAINPGNSGGGLFNTHGELIGIVNAKKSGTDVEGLGFAIPIKTAWTVASDIMSYGYVKGRVDPDAISFNEIASNSLFGQKRGLYVVSAPGTPFETGDYIVTVDGQSIKTKKEWNALLSEKKAGEQVVVVVERKGVARELSYTLPEKKA